MVMKGWLWPLCCCCRGWAAFRMLPHIAVHSGSGLRGYCEGPCSQPDEVACSLAFSKAAWAASKVEMAADRAASAAAVT